MATPFENFVNAELPKRISTNANPLTVPSGQVPVTTGVGLTTEFKPYGVGGSVDVSAVLSLLFSGLVVGEIPVVDVVDPAIYYLQHPYKSGSLAIYHNGIRLALGVDNDYVENTELSFRMIHYTYVAQDDIILIDYKRNDLGL